MLVQPASSVPLIETEQEEEEEDAPAKPLPAGPRDCSRRWSPDDRARLDAWAASVLPRARRAIERAFDRQEEEEEEAQDFLELPLSFALPLPLEVNGIADLPLSTLRAGLLPASVNAEKAKDEDGGIEAIASRLAEWLRFPYVAEALLDSASTSAAASSNDDDVLLSSLSKHKKHPKRPLPASVDWSTKNVLGPVKNQHINGTPCGCCWAFATTGAVEGVVGVVSGQKPPSLSEQQLIDCDRGGPFDDLGCEGGSVEGEWGERGREIEF